MDETRDTHGGRPSPEALRGEAELRRRFGAEVRARHPRFLAAVLADTEFVSANRGRPLHGLSRARVTLEAMRLMWETDAFFAQTMYRAKARLQGLGIPVVPRIFHRLANASSQICIGDPVVVEPGVHLPHGQVVIDGIVEVGSGAKIFPFTTIGLRSGQLSGPRIARNVTIGPGAKLIGNFSVGEGGKIGANSVVIDDVAAGSTVAGAPARPIGDRNDA